VASVLACHAVIELTCRCSRPIDLKMAKSRRWCLPDRTMSWVSTASPSTARTPARTTGVPSMLAYPVIPFGRWSVTTQVLCSTRAQ